MQSSQGHNQYQAIVDPSAGEFELSLNDDREQAPKTCCAWFCEGLFFLGFSLYKILLFVVSLLYIFAFVVGVVVLSVQKVTLNVAAWIFLCLYFVHCIDYVYGRIHGFSTFEKLIRMIMGVPHGLQPSAAASGEGKDAGV